MQKEEMAIEAKDLPKEKERQKIVRIGIVVICLLLLWGVKLGLMKQYSRLYSTGSIEIIPYDKQRVNYQYLEAMKVFDKLQPIAMKQEKTALIGEDRAEVIATTSRYGDFEKMQYVDGGFFTESALNEGRNHIVISDELAKNLFGSVYAVGNKCEIDELVYQVVGVYKKHRWMGDYLTDRGECVYIPFYSGMGNASKIDEVIIDLGQLDVQISKTDLSSLGLSDSNALIKERKNNDKMLQQIARVPLMLLVGWLIIISIKRSGNYIESIEEEWKLKVMKIAISLIIIIIGLGMIKGMLAIPSELLPQENIFDLKFYWECWKSACVTNNRLFREGTTMVWRGYQITKSIMWGLNGLECVIYYKVFKGLRCKGDSISSGQYL